jgi:large subunit ribosomal protein L4
VSTVDVLDATGTKTGTVDLPDDVFGVQVNVPLIHQVVVAQLAAARQGTHSTKTRGEVRGGGRKPYRQKGTGRARQGSVRAPQFAGGGVVHGPTPRDYSQRTPKKMKAAALRGALSDRAQYGRVHVVTNLVDGDAPSTRAAVESLAALTDRKHVLVVVQRGDDTTWLSLRNVERVHLLHPDQLNTYDVLVSDDVIFTPGALGDFLGQPVEVTADASAKPAKKAAAKKAAEKKPAAKKAAEKPAEKPAEPAAEESADAPVGEAPVAEAPVAEAPVAEAPVAEAAEAAEAAESTATEAAETKAVEAEEKPAKKATAKKATAKKAAADAAAEDAAGEAAGDAAQPEEESK